MKKNTKGGFYSWLEKYNLKIERAKDHDFLILAHILEANNFMLIFSTRSLLRNSIKQDEITNQSYLAMDATHKLVSCGMQFTTFATATLNQEIADIAYMSHYKENSETYVYGLTTIKETLKTYFNFEWKPKVLFFNLTSLIFK